MQGKLRFNRSHSCVISIHSFDAAYTKAPKMTVKKVVSICR